MRGQKWGMSRNLSEPAHQGNYQQASGMLCEPKSSFFSRQKKPPQKLYPASEPSAFVCWIYIRKI